MSPTPSVTELGGHFSMYDTHHQTKLSHRQVPANCADEMAKHDRGENTFSTTKGPTDKSTDAFAGVTIQFLVSQALAVCLSLIHI